MNMYEQANYSPSACNLSGLIYSLPGIADEIWAELRAEENDKEGFFADTKAFKVPARIEKDVNINDPKEKEYLLQCAHDTRVMALGFLRIFDELKTGLYQGFLVCALSDIANGPSEVSSTVERWKITQDLKKNGVLKAITKKIMEMEGKEDDCQCQKCVARRAAEAETKH